MMHNYAIQTHILCMYLYVKPRTAYKKMKDNIFKVYAHCTV